MEVFVRCVCVGEGGVANKFSGLVLIIRKEGEKEKHVLQAYSGIKPQSIMRTTGKKENSLRMCKILVHKHVFLRTSLVSHNSRYKEVVGRPTEHIGNSDPHGIGEATLQNSCSGVHPAREMQCCLMGVNMYMNTEMLYGELRFWSLVPIQILHLIPMGARDWRVEVPYHQAILRHKLVSYNSIQF